MGLNISATTNGTMILVGGGFLPRVAVDAFCRHAGGRDGRVAIVTTASRRQIKTHCLQKHARTDIVTRKHDIDAIRDATGVWFVGGDQERILSEFRETPMKALLHQVLARGGVVGGTSAGASCMSRVMVYENSERTGFGLLDHVIVDTHFHSRRRLSRLLRLLRKHPDQVGIGIDDNTSVMIQDSRMRVLGTRTVTCCDGNSCKVYRSGDVVPLRWTSLPTALDRKGQTG